MPDEGWRKIVADLQETAQSRYYGKYRGLVVKVDDQDKMGRITAKVPEVYGPDLESPWAMPAVPFAGAKHGLVLLPEPNDGVWIEFEAGDPSRPIWTGCWWAKDEMPAAGTEKGRVWVTTAGHQILLDEDNDEIRLVHPGGAEISLSGNGITLKMGSKQIEITSSGVNINGGALEVK